MFNLYSYDYIYEGGDFIEKISCIYMIRNLDNGKIYIGQTNDYSSRVNSHLSALRRGKASNKYLQASFNKHGEDRFEFSIVEQCPISELDDREMYWISTYDSNNVGYNMTAGGGGIRGYHFSEEQKAKISAANTGRIVSDETKQHMRDNHADFKGANHPNYGVPWAEHVSEEGQRSFREKMSIRMRGTNNPNYGKKMSDEQKSKLSESHKEYYRKYGNPLKGRVRPNLSGEKSPNARPVICLNNNEVFSYLEAAADVYNIAQSQLSMCCMGKQRFAGYSSAGEELFWMYLDEYEALPEEDRSKQYDIKSSVKPKRPHRMVRCLTTGEVFDQMKDACEKYHIDPSSLSAHCRGRGCKNGCGRHPETNELLKWEYID